MDEDFRDGTVRFHDLLVKHWFLVEDKTGGAKDRDAILEISVRNCHASVPIRRGTLQESLPFERTAVISTSPEHVDVCA